LTVVLCDPARARRDLVRGIIEAAGCIPRIVDAVPLDPRGLSDCDPLLLVAMANSTTQAEPVLKRVSEFKNSGCSIIAYQDGVKHWPMRSKCLPLVAGAAYLLDSASAGFGTELRRLLEEMLHALARRHGEQQDICDLMRRHGIVGKSPALTHAFRSAMRFSQVSDLPVLITGDTGTGKELLARAISRMDPKRKEGPFVTINCAAVNAALIESEFFGHRRGAFTGAERERKGLIRAAEGGVLFLDEIGELDLGLQAKLLRVLQERRVLSVGEEREAPVNVRFIAATNRNLEHLAAEQLFRADLFHRLRVLLIHIPPLRERPADLPLLIEYLLQKHRTLRAEPVGGVSQDFLEAVWQLHLPGNVRQLENLVCESLVNHRNNVDLDLNDLPMDVLRQLSGGSDNGFPAPVGASPEPEALLRQRPQAEFNELVKWILEGQGGNLSSALHECERQIFQAAMERTHGNQSQAARLLGITPRSVYSKVRKYRPPVGKDGHAA
jgi:transcriptional regulator with PAS, ATPase and Fis domain